MFLRISLILLTFYSILFAREFAVINERPRLFLDQSKLEQVAEYVAGYEAARFQKFISVMDGKLLETPKNQNELLFNTKNFAFLALAKRSGFFSRFGFGNSSQRYADKSFELANSINERTEDVHSAGFSSKGEGGFFTMALCVAYDWCHGDWSEQQKQAIGAKIIEAYNNRDKEAKIDFRQKLGMNMIAHSYQTGITGVTLYGDRFPGNEQLIETMLDDVQEIWLDRILKLAENYAGYPDGMAGWSEGGNYMKSATFSIAWMCAALSPALKRNLNYEFNFVRTFPLYLFFYANPFPIRTPGGDKVLFMQRNGAVATATFNENATLQQYLCTTAAIKNLDPRLAGFYKWVMDKSYAGFPDLEIPDYNVPEIYDLFFRFIFGVKDVAALTPEEAGINHAYRFGYGDVSIRSSFTPQATKLTFWTPSYYGFRHGTNNTSALFFHKYGEISAKAGVLKSDSSLPKGGTGSVLGHNSAAFYNGKNTTYGYKRKNNDFADRWDHKDNQPGGKNELGTLLAKSFNHGSYDYISYDYTASYRFVNFLDQGLRKVLYLHDPASPNYRDDEFVLLYDYSQVNRPEYQRRYLFQANERPQLVGGEWQNVSPGNYTASSEQIVRFQTTYANTHGAMLMKRLLPAGSGEVSYHLTGDEAGDYWFRDAAGKDMTQRKEASAWAGYWSMKYRFEMHHESTGNESEFLTIFQIGDANTLKVMADTRLTELPSHLQVEIAESRAVLLGRWNKRVSSLDYRLRNAAPRLHVISGLVDGRYSISVDGKALPSGEARDESLMFTSTGQRVQIRRIN